MVTEKIYLSFGGFMEKNNDWGGGGGVHATF